MYNAQVKNKYFITILYLHLVLFNEIMAFAFISRLILEI